MADGILTQARLKELLHYDQDTGVFTRRVAAGCVRSGAIAGSTHKRDGYIIVMIDEKTYYAHRLAWLYVHGNLPPDGLDHVNRVRNDNRLINLRLATDAENAQNRSKPLNNISGHMGVHWRKNCQKWQARITANGRRISLGHFTDINEAIAARNAAETKYHTFQHGEQHEHLA